MKAITAEDNLDYQTAAVCYARLLQANPRDRELGFRLANDLQSSGQPENARSLMVRLADRDDGGYPPAQLWLARQVIAEPKASNDQLATATDYLLMLLRKAPEDPEANYWLAISYARQSRWEQVDGPAAKVLDRLALLKQDLHFIAAAQGYPAVAHRWE